MSSNGGTSWCYHYILQIYDFWQISIILLKEDPTLNTDLPKYYSMVLLFCSCRCRFSLWKWERVITTPNNAVAISVRTTFESIVRNGIEISSVKLYPAWALLQLWVQFPPGAHNLWQTKLILDNVGFRKSLELKWIFFAIGKGIK